MKVSQILDKSQCNFCISDSILKCVVCFYVALFSSGFYYLMVLSGKIYEKTKNYKGESERSQMGFEKRTISQTTACAAAAIWRR